MLTHSTFGYARDDDDVHIGARVNGDGRTEIVTFAVAGEQGLKGVPDRWRRYRAVA